MINTRNSFSPIVLEMITLLHQNLCNFWTKRQIVMKFWHLTFEGWYYSEIICICQQWCHLYVRPETYWVICYYEVSEQLVRAAVTLYFIEWLMYFEFSNHCLLLKDSSNFVRRSERMFNNMIQIFLFYKLNRLNYKIIKNM